METRIIKNSETEQTYCHNCGDPKLCGKLRLKGHPFAAFICADCLDNLKIEITSKVN